MTSPVLAEPEFLQSVSKHLMGVVLDTPIHRHLHFTAPNTGIAAFDLITWPRHLCIDGDLGCFVFAAATRDLFEVFRQDAEDPLVDGQTLLINPMSWSGLLTATDMDGHEEFSHAKFRAEVNNWLDDNHATAADRAAAEKNVIELLAVSDESAFQAACQFDHGDVRFAGFATDADVTDYTYRYLWCCYAIVWAIGYYDEMVAANTEAAKSALPAPEVQL